MENIVYTIDFCPYCTKVKRLLADAGIDFEERLLATPAEINEVKDKYRHRTAPLVVLNGKFVGGCDDVEKLIRRGRLEQILSG